MSDPARLQSADSQERLSARLHDLQQLDLDLDRLQREEAQLPQDLVDLRRQMDDLNNRLEDTELVLERVEAQVRALDLDLKTTHEQIAHSRAEQEKNAFDPRAQTQYGSRIQQLSERAEEMEEDLAPLRARQDELSAQARDLRAQHRALRPRLGELEEQDEARIEALRQSGAERRARRSELAAALDARTIKEYDAIRRTKKGLGVAVVEGNRCSACHVSLPVNVQQRIAKGSVPPVKCPSCGRFLVVL